MLGSDSDLLSVNQNAELCSCEMDGARLVHFRLGGHPIHWGWPENTSKPWNKRELIQHRSAAHRNKNKR